MNNRLPYRPYGEKVRETMGRVFEVGHSYRDRENHFDPITVTRRTDKTIWVTNGSSSWMMRILGGGTYHEYAIDSSVPKAYRLTAGRYDATNEA